MNLSKPSVDLSPESINELARSFWHSAILRAGIKLDLFSFLEGNALTSNDVAQRIGAAPSYVQAFLESCVVLDLLEKLGDTYSNSPLASKFLVKGGKEYVGDHALHHTNTWASWGRLDEVIREGKTLLPYETGYVDADTYWTDYMMGQHNRAASGQAHYLVESVDLRSRRKLLDLGGGAASYSIALCGANPQLRAVVVDSKETPVDCQATGRGAQLRRPDHPVGGRLPSDGAGDGLRCRPYLGSRPHQVGGGLSPFVQDRL